MGIQDSTCWLLIEGAAGGDEESRDELARRYRPVIARYLAARWRGTSLESEVDDAVQEVLLDCFRSNGALARVEADRPGGFRPFLYGIARIVALRFERGRARRRETSGREGVDLETIPSDEATLSRVFDRAWATQLVREAVRLHEERARSDAGGPRAGIGAQRRVALLRLHFGENRPIRDIAPMWDVDPARLHKELARARRELREALLEVIARHSLGSRAEVETECDRLLSHFS